MLDRVQPSKPHGGATTVEARREYGINQKALRNFSTVYHMVVDWHGRPLAEVQRLGNPDLKTDPERPHREGPRLLEMRGPGFDGSWLCLGNGARGDDLIDMVAYLGSCDRRTAAEWLGSLVDRIVEVAA